jgi:hypothetical protein
MTAIEWLVEQLQESGISFFKYEIEFIEQAKEMEKQQIIDACQSTSNTDFWVKYESFEHYYNETFKQ